jgi:hypothetical protein
MSWICSAGFSSQTVSLLGFCVHEGSHFIVYELMEKGSLETQLHGSLSPMIGLVAYGCSSLLGSSYWKLLMVVFRAFTWSSPELAHPDEDCARHGEVLMMLLSMHFP